MKQLDVVLAGEDVLISNCTDDALSYSWDFGDGTTSTLKSPHHVWETPGIYALILEVENESGIKSKEMEITVSPSVYGSWKGEYYNGEKNVAFTFDLTQAAYKIKGSFWTAGPFEQYGFLMGQPSGVLSSNSGISQDSIKLDGALIYTQSFQDESISFSWIYKFEGVINESMDAMEGEKLYLGSQELGAWSANKIE